MNTAQAWAGDFGRDYHARDVREVDKTVNLFRLMLRNAGIIRTAVEFGAGTGTNLEALKRLIRCRTTGVEINPAACEEMQADEVICGSMLNVEVSPRKLAFTKGALIHIHPNDLPQAYSALFKASSKYIMLCEYFNPTPAEIEYRGQSGLLWKRDFAGEMMDSYPLDLLDYGFSYDRDPEMPSDNFNWFLLGKKNG